MNATPPGPGGWLESLRRIGASVLALLRDRFELFTVEGQEEKLRLIHLLIALGLAVAFGVAGVFVALFAVVFWLWTTAGYAGLIGLAAAALAVALGLIWTIRHQIRTGPKPFAHTVAEFRKDGECLRNNH
jgi:uncharacterized membrane protein YqjE